MSLIRRVVDKAYRTVWPPPPASGIHLCDLDGVKLKLDLSTLMHRVIYQREFERELTEVLHRTIRSGEVFVDVGANVGFHTLSLLVRRPDVRMVYAYEPAAQTFEMLLAGIEANGCGDRCIAQRLALSSTKGCAALNLFVGVDPMQSSLYPLADFPALQESVCLSTLDCEASRFIAPPAVIKCDVEGAELDVLRGSERVLSGAYGEPPIWFLEANYETAVMADYVPWELLEYASQFSGYEGFVIREGQVVPLACKKALRHGDTLILAVPRLHSRRFLASLNMSHGHAGRQHKDVSMRAILDRRQS